MSEIVKNLSVTLRNHVGVTCQSDTLLTHGAGLPAKGHNEWTGKSIHYPSPINAHCTLAQRALTQSRIELENVKKKKNPRQSVKLRACFVTLPELKEDFEKAEVEWHEKEKASREAGETEGRR
ncbi:hypothetical protein BDN67DRAFT_1044042 [Paxillus ammoniavirescens]|nr:hypothetical protein BDN67DRAFT_1044042 [Paxillus ammoniavirescens]